jgi:hypothetical protein
VGAAGAATIIAARLNFAAAASKISQKAVNYQDHPDGDKRCDKCIQLQRLSMARSVRRDPAEYSRRSTRR